MVGPNEGAFRMEDGTIDIAKIDKFIAWLEKTTDFGEWDVEVRVEVRRRLIALLEE